MNHYRYPEYDPYTYHINKTTTAFIKLEGKLFHTKKTILDITKYFPLNKSIKINDQLIKCTKQSRNHYRTVTKSVAINFIILRNGLVETTAL